MSYPPLGTIRSRKGTFYHRCQRRIQDKHTTSPAFIHRVQKSTMNIRSVAFVLLGVLAPQLIPFATGSKFMPTDDGMSVTGVFHAKVMKMHAKQTSASGKQDGMRQKKQEAMSPSAVKGKGNRPHPPPPPPPPTAPPPSPPMDPIPCFEGGDYCDDYNSVFDPCNKYTCNRDERRCIPEPREEGIPCGLDGDYYFDECNQGPGICRTIESDYGDFGVCMGVPKVGIPCNDYNECTVDDECIVVVTDDGFFSGQCMGKFAGEDVTCNDYYDYCTTNDRCQLISSDEGHIPVCKGDLIEGGTCNDYNECTMGDTCTQVPPRFVFDLGIRCIGDVDTEKVCDDYNECTDNDRCMEVGGADYTFVTCKGDLVAGRSCQDYDDCTVDDICKQSDYSDYAVCRGTPTTGLPCSDYNECTVDDVCVQSSSYFGDYIFCEGTPKAGLPCNDYDDCSSGDVCVVETTDYSDGEVGRCRGEPIEGGTCNDYNDCTKDDTCVLGQSGDYSFCDGSPAPGAPCNDYNDCTVDDVCVLSDSGDYAFCEGGTPTPGAPCNDYNDYNSNDVCVIEINDYGEFVFCQGNGIGPSSAPEPAAVPM